MTHEFTALDSDGEDHHYMVDPFKGRKLLKVSQQIMQACSGPIGEAIGNFARDKMMGDEDASLKGLASDIQDKSNGDWGDAIYKLATSVEFDKVALTLCENVVRDKSQELGNPKDFDEAFEAPALGELIEVITEVLKVNGFLPSGELSSIMNRTVSLVNRLNLPTDLESQVTDLTTKSDS